MLARLALRTAVIVMLAPTVSMGSSLTLSGCRPPSSGANGDAGQATGGTCRHGGDTCDFAPGKIGVCTEPIEGCAGVAACYVCTSLH